MQFGVPQYIDIEDRVAGPLTAKQLGWMLAMGAVLFVLWIFLNLIPLLIVGIPIALLFLALAFVKPHGFSLLSWVFHALAFGVKPREYVWTRPEEVLPKMSRKPVREKDAMEEKAITPDELAALAQTLDSEGMERSKKAEKLLKKYSQT